MAVLAYDWSWETFLKPLSFNGQTWGSSSRNVKPFDEYDDTPSLVNRFANELKMQDDQKTKERENDIYSAEQTLMSMWECRECGEYSEFDLEDLKTKWKRYQGALYNKSDRNISGSAWTMRMLQKYVRYEDIVFIQPSSWQDDSLFPSAQVNNIVEGNVAQSLSALCGEKERERRERKRESRIDENPTLFHDTDDRTEADSRIILDAILQPLCTAYELNL